MNPQTSHVPESSVVGAGSDVLKLDCPFCRGVLNLRRIHLGIEGACVYCSKPVMAIEDEAGCRLVSSEEIPESPLFSSANITSHPDAPDESEENDSASLHQNPPTAGPQVAPVAPSDSSKSVWGFPEKEKDETALNQIDPEEQAQPEIAPEISFSESAASPEAIDVVEDLPFQSQVPASELFPQSGSSIPEPADSFSAPPPLPEQAAPEQAAPKQAAPTHDAAEWFRPSKPEPFQEDAQIMDHASRMVDEQKPPPFQNIDTPPPLEDLAGGPAPLPPPLAKEAPFPTPEDTDASARQPLPGGISPFSTGSAKKVDPGFAEALFTDSPKPQSGFASTGQPEPAGPEMSPPDDAAFNAANQWGPPAVSTTSDGDELDFSAVISPAKAETPTVAATTPGSTRLPAKRKSGLSFLKKIFKFFLTIGVIGGIVFAAQTFVPQDKWAEWKQQAIDWLEPGTVILEKLPFGKNRNANPAVMAPVKKTESATRTRQQISEELLQVPQRSPGR